MHALCLVVAGALRATLPANEFVLEWQHSVQKTQWQETYRIDGDALVLVEARVQGSGAGMEPGQGARFDDGWWIWKPDIAPLRSLHLAHSSFTSDYRLCTRDGCTALGKLAGETGNGVVVTLRPCKA